MPALRAVASRARSLQLVLGGSTLAVSLLPHALKKGDALTSSRLALRDSKLVSPMASLIFSEQFWKIFYSAVILFIVITWRFNYHLSFISMLSVYNMSISQVSKINLFTYGILLFLITDLYLFTSNCPKINFFYLYLTF